MPKVNKFNNRLYVSIPQSIAEAFGIGEGDELEFFERDDNTIILAKKNVLLGLLEGRKVQREARILPRAPYNPRVPTERELTLLKKLDTLKYAERTKEKVSAMVNADERALLESMLTKRFLTLYRKNQGEPYKYGISKSIYDGFLYRKRMQQGAPAGAQPQQRTSQRPAERRGIGNEARMRWSAPIETSDYINELERAGYVVIKSEADATAASSALEENIREGLVVGTRAFDKKFYIGLRGFISRNAPKVVKALGGKSVGIESLSSELGMEEDAVKTILYILAESGDITEVRKDVFRVI